MKKTTRFRRYLEAVEILLLPVAPDALGARIAARAGFRALAAAGYANSAHRLGAPDVGLLTLTEMAECAARIVEAVELPVLADGDTGYGNVTNVRRTVQLLEKAGVAAIILEDQVWPKRCGHMAGKDVIPASEMAAKLKAALDARVDPDLVICARTDALAVAGLEAALERAQLYQETGADMIFVEAPETVAQMERIAREIAAPTLANMVPGGKTPLLGAAALQEMGFAAVAFPTVATSAVARALSAVFRELARTGSLAGLEGQLMPLEEFHELVGLSEIRQREEEYATEMADPFLVP